MHSYAACGADAGALQLYYTGSTPLYSTHETQKFRKHFVAAQIINSRAK